MSISTVVAASEKETNNILSLFIILCAADVQCLPNIFYLPPFCANSFVEEKCD